MQIFIFLNISKVQVFIHFYSMLSVSIKYKGKKQQYVFPVYMLYFSERRSIIYNKPYIYIHTHTTDKIVLKDTTYYLIWGMVKGFRPNGDMGICSLCIDPTPFKIQGSVFPNVFETSQRASFITVHNSSLYSLRTWWTLLLGACAKKKKKQKTCWMSSSVGVFLWWVI